MVFPPYDGILNSNPKFKFQAPQPYASFSPILVLKRFRSLFNSAPLINLCRPALLFSP